MFEVKIRTKAEELSMFELIKKANLERITREAIAAYFKGESSTYGVQCNMNIPCCSCPYREYCYPEPPEYEGEPEEEIPEDEGPVDNHGLYEARVEPDPSFVYTFLDEDRHPLFVARCYVEPRVPNATSAEIDGYIPHIICGEVPAYKVKVDAVFYRVCTDEELLDEVVCAVSTQYGTSTYDWQTFVKTEVGHVYD